MANEIQFSFLHGAVAYCLIRNNVGQIWNSPTGSFQGYLSQNYSGYVVSALEQGVASSYYTASMPTGVPAGSYNVVAKEQLGGTPAETDPTVDAGSIDWTGSTVAQLSDISTSGIITTPVQIQRGVMIQNYEFYLRNSSDHATPFTSGICSGQISKDGGAFGALQSGNFTEVGLGFYSVTLTSGDTSCNTMALLFSANNSIGSSDPVPQTFILQHSSGH